MYYICFFSTLIESVGYDPQRAVLQVRLLGDGRILQYDDVPEEMWYCLREKSNPDVYYRKCICGRFQESRVEEAEGIW